MRRAESAYRSLRLPLRELLSHLRILDLDFMFYPGYGYARCIFALRAGDIMLISLSGRRGWRRRRKYGRRT